MSNVWSLAGVMALWIGISAGLWWLHRTRIRRRQNRQLEKAERAVAYVAEASAVFDAIRVPVPLDQPPDDVNDQLRAETYALLKRIQAQGAYFDKANALRTQLQASLGIEDHEALSEVLHLRRDLWAASEIVLVEDPSSFGPAFADEGSYERVRTEAVGLLFKRNDRGEGGDDVIELRLSLAVKAAESFIAELREAIEATRERDRLPTISEIIAYPLAFFRAIPPAIRTGHAFVRAFFAHAADTARTIRDSEAMERGASSLRRAREDWPQRLSTQYERASEAARDSASAIRRHYDFLVTAYDFQSKYAQLLRRAPEVSERGRQFIARLELAERSERLRLTSTNAAIWAARGLLRGLGHLIAGLQRLHAMFRETTPWRFAAAIIAPAPNSARRTSAFRSYRIALAASGLTEALPEPRVPAKASRTKAAAKAEAKARSRAKPNAARVKTAKSNDASAEGKAPRPISAPAAPPTETDPRPQTHAKDSSTADGPSPPEKRPSFLRRLFFRTKSRTAKATDLDAFEEGLGITQAAADALANAEPQEPVEEKSRPSLMDKLSGAENVEPELAENKGEDAVLQGDADGGAITQPDKTDAHGALTLSVMDLQAKIKPKNPQIRSFPWLRG